jgi:hypothetical protein
MHDETAGGCSTFWLTCHLVCSSYFVHLVSTACCTLYFQIQMLARIEPLIACNESIPIHFLGGSGVRQLGAMEAHATSVPNRRSAPPFGGLSADGAAK